MKKRLTIFLIIFFALSFRAFARFPEFYSQYMFNKLAINPAYAGSAEALSVTTLYRDQWVNFEGAPVTKSLNFHLPVSQKKIALGMSVIHDKIGVTSNLDWVGDYAYRIPTKFGKIALGLRAGILVTHNNWNDIETTEEADHVFSENTSVIIPKFGFGAYFYNDKMEYGISVPHLTAQNSYPQLNEAVTYIPVYLYGAYEYRLNDNFSLKPSLLVKSIKTIPFQIDINAMLNYKKSISIGGSFRTNNTIVGLIKYDANAQLSIGYTYDYSVSEISGYNKGSHELMLNYTFKYPSKATDLKDFN